jgi:cytochrome c5
VSKNQDSAFLTTALGVLAALFAITFGIIVVAGLMSGGGSKKADPEQTKKLQARLAPVGKVITDPAMLVKASTNANRTPLAADEVFAQVCSACHVAGVLCAPKIGDKAEWSKRKAADGGVAGLAANAIKGRGQMPAKGGNPDLTEDEIKQTVELMLKKTGV